MRQASRMKLQFLQYELYIYRLAAEEKGGFIYSYIHLYHSILIRIEVYVYGDVISLILHNLPSALRCDTLI